MNCNGIGARVLMLVMTVSTIASAGETRTWKSKSGDYEVTAEFVSANREAVRLLTEDGRELEIELKKLSDADREFVVDATNSEAEQEKLVRRTVLQFYRAVEREPDAMRSFLTSAGQGTFDGNRAFFEKLRGPDQNHRVRVGKMTIEETTAIAEYRLRMEGKSYRMKMPMLSEDGKWKVLAIIGPNPDGHGENLMDFEQGTSANGIEDALAQLPAFQPQATVTVNAAAAEPAAVETAAADGGDSIQ